MRTALNMTPSCLMLGQESECKRTWESFPLGISTLRPMFHSSNLGAIQNPWRGKRTTHPGNIFVDWQYIIVSSELQTKIISNWACVIFISLFDISTKNANLPRVPLTQHNQMCTTSNLVMHFFSGNFLPLFSKDCA